MSQAPRFTNRLKSHHIGKDMMSFARFPRPLREILDSEGKPDQVIYIHVPYCTNICSFCNMNRSFSKPDPNYANYVIEQIKQFAHTRRFGTSTIDSIYFGGGTPSVLSADDINRILDAIAKSVKLSPTVEISLETSLTDLGIDKLKAIKEHGVNRLSIGVQTFSDRGRALLERRGSGDYAKRELSLLLREGITNINIDLIYNYLNETPEELENDIKTIKELDIAGFSFYSLIIMQASKLGKRYAKAGIKPADTPVDFAFFTRIVEASKPFDFLELTKLVQPGRDRYAYIRQRLAGKDTFPLGAGAGGTIGEGMMMNPVSLSDFLEKNVRGFDSLMCMTMSPAYFAYKRAIDTVQLLSFDPKNLAISDQVAHQREALSDTAEKSADLLARDQQLVERADAYMQALCSEGYVYENDGHYTLTQLGAFWGNNIVSDLWNMVIDTTKEHVSD